jgi:hypothetical protein
MPEYPQRGVAVVQRQISDGTFTVPGGARRPYCPLRVGLHPSRTASCSHWNVPVLVQTPAGSFERIRMSRSAPGKPF